MTKERHPAGLYVLFATEMWERFSFYTMLAMLTLYMRNGTEGFNWSSGDATNVYANYLMFVYASPIVGGLIADRKLGFRRTVMIGAVFMALGHVLMAFPLVPVFYAALTCLVIGNGFFKPNISAMVGSLYPEGSKLKDSAYNIFYMGINVGAFLAPIVAEFAKSAWGFHVAFTIAGAGMFVSLGIFWIFKRHIEGADYAGKSAAEKTDLKGSDPLAHIPDRNRILGLMVIFAIVIVFWMVFHQNGSTLTYWADSRSDWSHAESFLSGAAALVGWQIQPKFSGIISNAINPGFVIMLTYPLIWFWSKLRERGLEPSTPAKIGCGMFLTSAGFAVMVLAAKQLNGAEAVVSFWWLVAAYAIITLGELCLSPMGLSLVSKVAPPAKRGLMMGGWFVATAIGNKMSGVIGVHWPEGGHGDASGVTLWSYETFFLVCTVSALVMGMVLFMVLRPLKRTMPGV